jgi:molecular chaperone Hsp33
VTDYLVRVSAKSSGVRGFACVTTNLVRQAAAQHATSNTATAVLGRTLTGGILLGALLKVSQRVALKFDGDGPIGKAIAEADSYGRIRGYVGEPQLELPFRDGEPDVAEALGRAGVLTVTKDLRLRDLYRGVVSLQTGEVDVDLDYYLNQSEQIPSTLSVAVDVDASGEVLVAAGYLLQAIPPYQEGSLEAMRARAETMFPLSEWLKQGQTPEAWLEVLFAGTDHQLLEQRPLRLECGCSRERMIKALLSLGRAELAALADEGAADVQCHFCGRQHVFPREELTALMDQIP